ncbi:hypothetical protein BH18GEM1_BH18GEM1_15450 [soil metagenome]
MAEQRRAIVDAETELDRRFAERTIDGATLQEATRRIADLEVNCAPYTAEPIWRPRGY